MKKRLFPLLLILVMVLTACNNKVTIQNTSEKKQTVEKPKVKETDPFKEASFLRDPSKTYTYEYSNGYVSIETIEKDNGSEQIWNMDLGESGTQQNIYQESNEGLFVGIVDSEGYTAIVYPIKVGASWEVCTDPEDCTNYKIAELLDSYQTPAGKFEHVVVIEADDGGRTYYAKNIGLLAYIDKNGEVISQLKSLQESGNAAAQSSKIDPTKEVYNWDNVKDTNGKRANVKIVAEQDKTYLSDMSWAGAQEGDTIREGSYKLLINDIPQDVKIGDWVFNMNKNSGEVIGDAPNLIVVNQTEASNSYSSKIFYIHDGKMVEVKNSDGTSDFSHSGDHIYPISKDTFIISWYNNADVETYYEVFTYKIVDFASGKTNLIKEEQVSLDKSEAFFAPLKKYR
ncbi:MULTISPECIES: hypothetical protein [Bacillaceae]|uniref:hypothetical protein n=1 Tax=Bacillaceae TaxID=186817 RepID=UPI00101D34F0|nr:hypothetical protein [Ectobacillus funiculus]